MNLRDLIAVAKREGASDLHLEPGLSPVIRVRGNLRSEGAALASALTLGWARELLNEGEWTDFQERRSSDLSRTIDDVRCRLNIFHTSRGVAFAVRLFPTYEPTLESLNLHPDLKNFVNHTHGLVLISGPTGSGKSTTLAALINALNSAEARHIVTVENPIEYSFRSRRSFIRQREVGRDTPSFKQALLDALREDPDVLVVGEMRDPETMQLTLNAAETGHLVLATVHSASCTEAVQRVVNAFPAEAQQNVAAQLADCLIGGISQKLQFRPASNLLVPECEIMIATLAIKNFIRTREFFKIISAIETGADHNMYTFGRYRNWLDKRPSFVAPDRAQLPKTEEDTATELRPPSAAMARSVSASPKAQPAASADLSRINIEPTETFDKILKRP